MASKNVQAIQAEHAGFNARDWESIQRLIADDCVFVDGSGVAHKGPQAFVMGYRATGSGKSGTLDGEPLFFIVEGKANR